MADTSLLSLHGHTLAAVDIETTGRLVGKHEICQIAVVPLNCHIKPTGEPFNHFIRPHFKDAPMEPDAVRTHGLTKDFLENGGYLDWHTVGEMLWEWYQELMLPPGKKLIPLIHNASFDSPRIESWLGYDLAHDIFGYPIRDTSALLAGIIDKAAFKGMEIPYNGRVSLPVICKILGIEYDAHDALSDCVATAELYRKLLNMGVW